MLMVDGNVISLTDNNLVDYLTSHEAFRDSPAFRHNLSKAELIGAQIHAHYNVAIDCCRQAAKTGEAFAQALTRLAHCTNVELLPKHTCSLSEIPCRWSGLGHEPATIVHQVDNLLRNVAACTEDLALRLGEPERILSEARTQLDQLSDLRMSFHRAGEQLEAALTRSASLHTTRSPSDLVHSDTQVTELRQIYRNAATAYLSALRSAISSTPMLTFFRSTGMLVAAEQSFMERLRKLSDDPSASPSSTPPSNSSVLLTCLNKLANWAETNCRISRTQDQYTEMPQLEGQMGSSSARLEDYLFKRSTKRKWRIWVKRWFLMSDNKLIYCKRVPNLSTAELLSVTESTMTTLNNRLSEKSNNTPTLANGTVSMDYEVSKAVECSELFNRLLSQSDPEWKVMEPDLRICTAREGNAALDRRFTFELISPVNRVHLLQAESYDQKERWVAALRSGLQNFQQYNSSNRLYPSERENGLSDQRHSSPSRATSVSSADQATIKTPEFNHTRSRVTGPYTLSQQSIPDYDQLRSQGGIILWREPDTASNRLCADCSADGASWASINLGVTLCTHCAAAHRSLGVHVSKIRSLTLDNWEPELLHLMLNLGNKLVNRVYEANTARLGSPICRPTTNSSGEERRRWARAKWAQCQFVKKLLVDSPGGANEFSTWICDLYQSWSEMRERTQATTLHPGSSKSTNVPARLEKRRRSIQNQCERKKRRQAILAELCETIVRLQEQTASISDRTSRRSTLLRTEEQEVAASSLLCVGARLGCPPLMLAGLAAGAHPDSVQYASRFGSRHQCYPPLIWAVRSGSLAACEFLLLNGADIDAQDELGRTALHHACQLQRVHLACLLLRRRADQRRRDHKGRIPLDIAVDMQNGDIVTLLRLQRLHDDAKDSNQVMPDETVSDVFRDYISRAYFVESESESSDLTVVDMRHTTSSPSINMECPSVHCVTPEPLNSPPSHNVSITRQTRSSTSQHKSPTVAADSRRRFLSPGPDRPPPDLTKAAGNSRSRTLEKRRA
ncbi:unnamed protein product [Dicrocoelium dendriticum]|nr:unnamed protein product [Dicrocoelium dendriticum]